MSVPVLKNDDILGRIIATLYSAGDMAEAIGTVLEMLGKHYEVDRVYICENSPDGTWCRRTYEWCAEGIAPHKSALQRFSYVLNENGENVFLKSFDENGIFWCADTGNMPAPVGTTLRESGVQSILQYAIVEEGTFRGFIGLDDHRMGSRWNESDFNAIQSVIKLIGLFLIKARREQEAEFSIDFVAALDKSPSMVALIEPNSLEIRYSNPAMRAATTENCNGQTCFRAIRNADAPCELCPVKRLISGASDNAMEMPLRDRWYLAQCSKLRWSGKDLVMLMCTDITAQKRAELELAERNAENDVVIEQSGKALMRYDIKKDEMLNYGDITVRYGLPRVIPDFFNSVCKMDILMPDSVHALKGFLEAMKRGDRSGSVNLQFHFDEDEHTRWFRSDFTTIFDAEGRPSHSIISSEDITELRKKELAWEKLQNDIKSRRDACTLYVEANLSGDEVELLEGIGAEFVTASTEGAHIREIVDTLGKSIVYVEDRPGFYEFFETQRLNSLYDVGVYEDELEFRIITGDIIRWLKASVQMVKYPYSDDIKLFAVVINTDREHRERERLENLAYHDSITRLLNRETTEERIREALKEMGSEESCAMFIIDLDDFKTVNDTKGHLAGDSTLRDFSRAMSGLFGEGDIVGRIGGDEFMVFVRGCPIDKTEALAARIVNELQFSIDAFVVTASVGAVCARAGASGFEQLYMTADAALYRAKNAGKSQCEIVDFSTGGDEESVGAGGAEAGGVLAAVQLKTLMENLDAGVVLADVNDGIRVTYVNPGFYHAMHTENEINEPLDTILRHIDPVDFIRIKEKLMVLRPGDSCDETYRVAGQSSMWHHLRVSCLSRREDGVRSILAIITDISSLMLAEKKLRRAEEKYRVAVSQMGGLLWEVDLDTQTLYETEELAAFFSDELAEFKNVPDSLLKTGRVMPDSESEYLRMFSDIFNGVEGKTYTILLRNSKNAVRWTKQSFRLLRHGDGTPYRAVGVMELLTNVETDIRRYQEELRFMELILPHILGELRVDLTTGIMDKCILTFTSFKVETLAEFAELCPRFLAHEEDVERFRSFIDGERISAEYRRGRVWIYENFDVRFSDGSVSRVNITFHLIRRPSSGNLIGFVYIKLANGIRSKAFSQDECDSVTMLCSRESLVTFATSAIDKMAPDERYILSIFEIKNLDKIKTMFGLQTAQKFMFMAGRVCRNALEGNGFAASVDESHIAIFKKSTENIDNEYENEELGRSILERMLSQTFTEIDVEVCGGFAAMNAGEMDFTELFRRAQLAAVTMRQAPRRRMTKYITLDETQAGSSAAGEHSAPEENGRIVAVSDDPAFLDGIWSALGELYRIDVSTFDDVVRLIYRNEYRAAICDFTAFAGNLENTLYEFRNETSGVFMPIIAVIKPGDKDKELELLNLGAASVCSREVDAETLRVYVRNVVKRVEFVKKSEKQRLFELRFQQQENLLYTAEHDLLTGLLNQQSFARYAREKLDADPDKKYVLIRWDVDNFKVVNDTMGIEVGDRILRSVGDGIRSKNYESCLSARLSGDHFAHLAEAGSLDPEKLLEDIGEWFSAYRDRFKITNCMGVYYIDDPTLDIGVMCDRALLALRAVKGTYTTSIGYYDDAMRTELVASQNLTRDMIPGIEKHQFKVYFQPQYNYSDGSILGAEALVRWAHPTLGFLSPDKFIPLFEKNGMIFLLDEYVWEESCRYMSEWLRNKDKVVPVSVAVNISRMDLYVPNLAGKLKALVERYALPPSYLRLEITESAYMQNSQQLINVVRELHDLGFTVEMDDFGSGYSSLNMLKDVPVDILKLDVRFLSAGEDDSRGGNILSSVIRMAHWLKIPVIAEGVEKQAQAEYLKSLNCVYMQGYFFARPMPADEFERLIDRSNIGSTDKFNSANLSGMAEFWNPSTQSTLIFNSFIGAVCIMEYNGVTLEILRSNDAFYRELGWKRDSAPACGYNLLDLLDYGNRTVISSMRDSLENVGDEAECELYSLVKDEEGERQWFRCRAKLLARNGSSDLFYTAIENVTEKKRVEERALGYIKEIHKYQRASEMGRAWERLVMRDPRKIMFVYNAEIDVLSYKYTGEDGNEVSCIEKNFLTSGLCTEEMRAWYEEIRTRRTGDRGERSLIIDRSGETTREYIVNYSVINDENDHVRMIIGELMSEK